MMDDLRVHNVIDLAAGAKKHELSPINRLRAMSVTTRLSEMEAKLQNDKYIFPDMALAGTTTLFYSPFNGGKTAFALRFLIDGIESGQIDPACVFYLNADDSYEGLFHKGKIAEKFGFAMISPAENRMTPDEVLTVILELAGSENAAGLIFILDTLKKFADMMSKRSQATLYEALRRLNAVGATVILLGHTNKHPDQEGKLIYEGTSDTLNDIDVAYAMYTLTDKAEREQIVEFRNTKDRGKVIACVSYSYTKDRTHSYMDMLRSIKRLDDKESQLAAERARQDRQRTAFESVLLFLREVLAEPMNESSILKIHKSGDVDIAAEFSANELKKGLRALIGVELDMVRDKQHKNAKFYSLRGTAAASYREARDGGV